MCRTPRAPEPKEDEGRPNVLVTARDGQPITSSAQRRRRSGLRLDLNAPSLYQGLTIPRGY